MRVMLVFLALLLPPLAVAQERRRDFLGDPLPERALFRIGTTRLQQGGLIQGMAVSDDGRLLASCGGQTVRVWDGKDGRPLWSFSLPHWGPWALAFSRDGKELAALSRSAPETRESGDFRRWDLATGRELTRGGDSPAPFDGTVVHMALVQLPGGEYAAAETRGADISLYSPGVPRPGKTLKGHNGRVMSVGFTRDGKTPISLGDDGTIRSWRVADGKEIRQVSVPKTEKYGLKGNLAALAVSADGQSLAVSLPDGSTRLLDATVREVRRLPTSEQMEALAFSADGKSLITGRALVHLWDVATAKEIPILKESCHPIQSLSLSPDGKTLACADDHEQVRLVEVASGKTLFHGVIPCRGRVVFSPTGQHLAVLASETTIALWDVATLRTAKPFTGKPTTVISSEGKVASFAFAPDGKRLATVETAGQARSVRLYDVALKKMVLRIDPPDHQAFAVGFSPDGKLLGTTGSQATVFLEERTNKVLASQNGARLWDSVNGSERPVASGLRGTAHTMVFHPSGKSLVGIHLPAAANAPRVGFALPDMVMPPPEDRLEPSRLWDIPGARERFRFQDPLAREMAESAMGWIIGRSSAVPAAFSPDGRLFATPGVGGIVLFETASGQPRLRLAGHLQEVTAVAFTPDGKTLLSSSSDGTVLIWDITGPGTTARLPGTAVDLWASLADLRPERAGQALGSMVARPAEALAVLRKHLKPVTVGQNTLSKLIAELDDPKFTIRDQATRELANLGPLASKALTAKLRTGPSLETAQRIEKLLSTIAATLPTPEQLQLIRGVEVLERIGTPEARRHLQELAQGAEGARLTDEAREALQRMNRKGP
ncbi:MAG TPA: hypothetical protein VEL76_05915 [Gemmataceae bacterium]|nr:hypothetical protein [Gemmataceae bacterium]